LLLGVEVEGDLGRRPDPRHAALVRQVVEAVGRGVNLVVGLDAAEQLVLVDPLLALVDLVADQH